MPPGQTLIIRKLEPPLKRLKELAWDACIWTWGGCMSLGKRTALGALAMLSAWVLVRGMLPWLWGWQWDPLGYDAFVRILDTVAWPAAVLCIVLLFRNELSGLIGRIREVSFGGLSLRLAPAVKHWAMHLKEQAVKGEKRDQQPTSRADETWQFLVNRTAQRSPTEAVLEAFARIQQALESTNVHLLQDDREPRWQRYASVLWSTGRLRGELARLIGVLSEMRDDVANLRQVPTAEQARDYVEAARAVTESIEIAVKAMSEEGQTPGT